MKYIKYSIAMLLALSAVSCNEELNDGLPAPQEQTDMVTIKAAFTGDALSKVETSDGFSWAWSSGDRLAVTGNGVTQVFKIVDGFSPKNAEFTGKAVNGESFTIQYPESGAAIASFAEQKQKGNNNLEHIRYIASLEGVDDYTSFAFSSAWAAEHKGALKQTGIFKIVMTLPDSVSTVTKVSVMADNEVFYSSNGEQKVKTLELEMENTSPDDNHVVTAWMTTSWNEAVVPAGDFLTVSVKTGSNTIEKVLEMTKDATLMGGMVNVFELDNTDWAESAGHYSGGRGTEASPWIIMTPEELLYLKDDIVAEERRFFKLGADIDMAAIDNWTPLCVASPFKQIDFDGDGHTIKNFTCAYDGATNYTSFFGVLYGKCHDVTFTNATITSSKGTVGIIAGYGGSKNGAHCEAWNVHVQGKVTGEGKCGGLFGLVRDCVIEQCSADVVVDGLSGKMCGGLFGADTGDKVIVRDCFTSGSVVSGASICGGIAGDLVVAESSIYNSFSTATVTTQYIFGGILGRATANKDPNATNCEGQTPNNHIENCIAWNDALTSNCEDDSEHYGSGAVVGAVATHNYLVNCIRKPDLQFTLNAGNANLGTYSLIDNENASPESPLVKPAGTGQYYFCYNGKVAETGKTLTQVARDLGWAEEIWDFSSDIPVLKK